MPLFNEASLYWPAAALFIVFLVLKLTGTINWPWLWVVSPIWITLAVILIVFLFNTLGSSIHK